MENFKKEKVSLWRRIAALALAAALALGLAACDASVQGQINEYIGKMEEITGKKFGDLENPLLVSVRRQNKASYCHKI